MGMEIRSFVVGPIDVNCYVVQDTETKQGMIIDPGGNGEAVWQYIRQASIDVQSIVNTHAHGDHIGAVDFLREKTGQIFASMRMMQICCWMQGRICLPLWALRL